MPRRQPPPIDGQMELTIARDQQHELIRRVNVGGPTRRLMMYALDSRINVNRKGSWALTYEELGKDMEVEEKTAYKIARELEQLGVIRREREGNKTRFSICWGMMWALDEEQNGEGSEQTKTPVRDTAEILPLENPILPTEKVILHRENSILRTAKEILPLENPTTYLSGKSGTTPTPTEEAPAELVVLVAKCNVGQAGEAVTQALANGMTPEQIRDVVDHYRAPENAGRWSAGVLFNRLTRVGAFALDADAGWYGDSAEWLAKRRQTTAEASKVNPEIRWGPELDRLSSDELMALAEQMTPRDRDFALRSIQAGNARQLAEARRLFLRQLAQG